MKHLRGLWMEFESLRRAIAMAICRCVYVWFLLRNSLYTFDWFLWAASGVGVGGLVVLVVMLNVTMWVLLKDRKTSQFSVLKSLSWATTKYLVVGLGRRGHNSSTGLVFFEAEPNFYKTNWKTCPVVHGWWQLMT